MADYQTFTLRSPDRDTFLADLKAALDSAGIDPYEKGLLYTDEDGSDKISRFLSLIEPGGWYITEPSDSAPGTKGDYLLINGITKDPDLIEFIEGFAASDASLQPSEISDSEKIGGGTHRVNQDTIDSPVRTW